MSSAIVRGHFCTWVCLSPSQYLLPPSLSLSLSLPPSLPLSLSYCFLTLLIFYLLPSPLSSIYYIDFPSQIPSIPLRKNSWKNSHCSYEGKLECHSYHVSLHLNWILKAKHYYNIRSAKAILPPPPPHPLPPPQKKKQNQKQKTKTKKQQQQKQKTTKQKQNKKKRKKIFLVKNWSFRTAEE